jgi:hypothetical protein
MMTMGAVVLLATAGVLIGIVVATLSGLQILSALGA